MLLPLSAMADTIVLEELQLRDLTVLLKVALSASLVSSVLKAVQQLLLVPQGLIVAKSAFQTFPANAKPDTIVEQDQLQRCKTSVQLVTIVKPELQSLLTAHLEPTLRVLEQPHQTSALTVPLELSVTQDSE